MEKVALCTHSMLIIRLFHTLQYSQNTFYTITYSRCYMPLWHIFFRCTTCTVFWAEPTWEATPRTRSYTVLLDHKFVDSKCRSTACVCECAAGVIRELLSLWVCTAAIVVVAAISAVVTMQVRTRDRLLTVAHSTVTQYMSRSQQEIRSHQQRLHQWGGYSLLKKGWKSL